MMFVSDQAAADYNLRQTLHGTGSPITLGIQVPSQKVFGVGLEGASAF